MAGEAVTAQAVRRFEDESRVQDVFEALTIV